MRVLGITIPDNKQIQYALTSVYGIGLPRAQEILHEVGVLPTKKTSELSEKEESLVREKAEKFSLEGDLKREVSVNIKRLKDIKSYRGQRHSRGLPVRGQRTKTNSRTVRGNRRTTMASGRVTLTKT